MCNFGVTINVMHIVWKVETLLLLLSGFPWRPVQMPDSNRRGGSWTRYSWSRPCGPVLPTEGLFNIVCWNQRTTRTFLV